MKGFFGILGLGNTPIGKTQEVFLSNCPEIGDYPKIDSERIFLTSINDQYPVDSVPEFIELTYAGWSRLDNLPELRESLGLDETAEDQEVILYSFKKWGSNCVKYFYGDFSFAIWNQKNETLFLAKDQLGARPLFYLQKDDLLIFGTSIPLIKKSQKTKLLLNEVFIAKELKFYPQDVEATFFRDIVRLKPAHYIDIKPNQILVEKRYWELLPIELDQKKTNEEYYDLVRNQMIKAIQVRLRNMTKVGCQLSGGMDSSAIAVLLSRLIPKENLHTYSFVLDDETKKYSEAGIDEKETQEEIINYADLNRSNHHQIHRFHYRDAFEEINSINEIFGGSSYDYGNWQETIFRDFSKKYLGEVMFSGFPGDEGISSPAGSYFYDYLAKREYLEIFKFILEFRRWGIKNIFKYYRDKKSGTFFPEYAAIQKTRDLLNPSYKVNFDLKDTSFLFSKSFKYYMKSSITGADTCMRMEAESIFANHYGIDMVFPLADVRLLELIYSLPSHVFKPKPKGRALFRNVCKGILPERVRLQKKQNGAFTLAFYEYHTIKKFDDLKTYSIKNRLVMFTSEKNFLHNGMEDELDIKDRINALKQMDILIELNSPTKDEVE
ncbi:asparagine synthase (glutamine-hydrolysing) [Algoriphagus boseongensis]|uniref:asparagine synthase (glutamine-hydrolyzing) n=1 Tax=Algoriphagus boseongensis TaxID=1442587 RepID=A0A4R6T841_9BACT|nr:asparagine synthase-related protein [Algoriphagus boseongensis]TDQ19398.1 asparagine synthase (glutamine-hydrolysing) [Algoriphagus boseongensis]